ncbi:MAG: protein kinase [Acidobacteria bacterium]|nr:protein kinase [Acidobacteriota bacterium]
MKTQRKCPDCGSPLPIDAPEGICPECLMKGGLEFSQDTTVSIEPIDIGEERNLPNPGDQFGEYRIERILGRGGMGAVYEAEQLETGRRVALKVLSHRLDSAEARARFFREGRLAASINHPNSVYVYGTGEVDSTPVIVMELVDGGTLQERVKRRGPFPVGKAVDAIIDVISGLQAAQAKGILHRDIKPSNCFEDADGSVKVGDFGLSISSEASEDTELTSDGLFLGTPAFCSPEQLRGEELNARSDLYSVGVTLFYLLTGRTPFEGHTSVQLVADVLEKAPPSPKNFRPEIPDELARLVLRCLEKTPGERFRNYGELHRALIPFGTAAPAPAPLRQRFVAGMIDMAVFSFLSTAIGLCFAGGSMTKLQSMGIVFYLGGREGGIMMAVMLLGCLAMIFYYALLEGRWGYSLGKAACRLRVVDADRNTPGFGKAALRAAIYVMSPYLPFWIYFGLVAAGIMGLGDTLMLLGTSYAWYPIFGLLFSTARKRNGLAGLHDLASGTRVVRKPKLETRLALPLADLQPVVESESMPRVGAFHVIEKLGQRANDRWLLAYDTRLLRKVWIHEVPAGTPELPGHQKTLKRVGRLRWITGRRSGEENWDAFEAPAGAAFPDLAAKRQSWERVRFWLFDLAEELTAAAKDGTVPDILSLDRIWITAEGRAKLLDFPAPGLKDSKGGDHAYEPDSFLSAVASTALEGGIDRPAEDRLSAPVPLHARQFLEDRTVLSNPETAGRALKRLTQRPTRVTRLRRLAVVAGCFPVPVLAFFFFMFIISATAGNIREQPEIHELGQLLAQRQGMFGIKTQEFPDDRRFAIFIAHRYRDIVTNPEVWDSYTALFLINGRNRVFVEQSIEDPPESTQEEIAEVEAIMENRFLKEIAQGMKGMGNVVDNKPWVSLLLAGASLLVFVAVPAIIAALCFRGGLFLLVFGVSVVRKDGRRASRIRVFWRSLLAWIAPVILAMSVFVLVGMVLEPPRTDEVNTVVVNTAVSILGLFMMGLIVWSTLLPDRSIPDRLSGTRLVRR